MVNYLNNFYKFYQTCETPQCIDLSKSKHQYLCPSDHPDAGKMTEAARDLESTRTKVQCINTCLYQISEAPKWLIRGRPTRYSYIQDAPSGPLSSHTLRVVMNHRLKKVVEEQQLDVVLPDEYLIVDPNIQRSESKLSYKDFFVISEKLDIYDFESTVKELKSLDAKKQREVATTICRLIYHSGFMDAHMANIVLTKDRKIAVIDTEGISLIHDVTEKSYVPIALSDARIVGLKEFISRSKEASLPPIFAKTAERYLFYARIMDNVKQATLFMSVICPLIPLVVLICSVTSEVFQSAFFSRDKNEQSRLQFQPAVCNI